MVPVFFFGESRSQIFSDPVDPDYKHLAFFKFNHQHSKVWTLEWKKQLVYVGMIWNRNVDNELESYSFWSRLNNNGFCQVIPFKVPRKSELFQEDLYPDTQVKLLNTVKGVCAKN